MDGFDGKVAFVTGGGSGFGAAFASALAERGAAVTVADIDAAAAGATTAAITDAGGRALAAACDVADEAQVARAVADTMAAFGGVDILINNAGLHSAAYNKGFGELGHARVRRLFDVNVMGVINCSLACRAAMAARGGGRIVNIASIAGYGCGSAYGVSKLAVRGLTIEFAGEFAADGILVNAIAPGLIATDVIRAEMPAALFDQFLGFQHVKRTGAVADIVATMLHLCSPAASFVTGETLKVAGGYPLAI